MNNHLFILYKNNVHSFQCFDYITQLIYDEIDNFLNNEFSLILYEVDSYYNAMINLFSSNYDVINKYDLNDETDVYNLLSRCGDTLKYSYDKNKVISKILKNEEIKKLPNIIDIFVDNDFLDNVSEHVFDEILITDYYIECYIKYLNGSLFTNNSKLTQRKDMYLVLKYLSKYGDFNNIEKLLEHFNPSYYMCKLMGCILLTHKDFDLYNYLFEKHTSKYHDIRILYNSGYGDGEYGSFNNIILIFKKKYINSSFLKIISKIYGDDVNYNNIISYLELLYRNNENTFTSFEEFVYKYLEEDLL